MHQPRVLISGGRLEHAGSSLAVDDDDASEQLELFYAALAGDPLLGGTRRSHITVNPRGGWQGYGHPDVTSRG